MNHEYYPDGWRLILIDNQVIKLFSSWSGGYLDGNSWRLNSGCTKIEPTEYGYDVHGYSGSIYSIHKHQGNLNAYSSSVYAKILAQEGVEEVSVERAIELLEELV